MAMYRQQTSVMPQNHFNNGTSTPNWYNPYGNNSSGHHNQQLLNCMQDGGQESANQQVWHHHSVFHQHHPEYLDQKYLLPHGLASYDGVGCGSAGNALQEPPPQLPSPPMSVSEMSSPGNITPPQQRPPAIRSPFDWINKPNYQTQPNPGKLFFIYFG